ncbi:MAG: hypothetical protein HYR70_08910 [Chloroflexi bacterium]|nr:hypothetical protein [Chloroflexota bacterium]MBI3339050.1 hypothetical protein [Chloroflexota bacterium]
MDPNMSTPAPMRPQPQKKNNTWLIAGGAFVFLCCCCLIFLIVAYQYGDQILKALGQG